LQESLANTFRHAAAKDCRITLSSNSEHLFLEVSDKGPGFDVEAASKKGRHGLRGMRQRVEVVGGTFDVTSTEGVGTQIKVSLPLTSRGVLDD
jgi:signal transduction histidine kinase